MHFVLWLCFGGAALGRSCHGSPIIFHMSLYKSKPNKVSVWKRSVLIVDCKKRVCDRVPHSCDIFVIVPVGCGVILLSATPSLPWQVVRSSFCKGHC